MGEQRAPDSFDLTGRVAIVTGGSRGIGLAIARGFARAGARVVVASRKADACAAAVKEIETAGGQALAVPAHMGEPAALQSLVDRTAEHFGGIDVLVNNAANGWPSRSASSRSRRGTSPWPSTCAGRSS